MSRWHIAIVLVLTGAATATAQHHSHEHDAHQHGAHQERREQHEHTGNATSDHSHRHEHHSYDAHAASHAQHGQGGHGVHRDMHSATPSELAHIPPDPPRLELGHISKARMIELMQMDDNAVQWLLDLTQLEAFHADSDWGLGWEFDGWLGTDTNKLVLKSEGERIDGETQMRNEVLWDRIVSRWWSVQVGLRHDSGEGPSRTWAALGVEGLAPYFIELEATLYAGEHGRTAVRVAAHTDWLLTQRLILQPQFEVNAYGKDDRANALAAGVADFELGLRLRYEIVREFAPYLGMKWQRAFGKTADWRRAAGVDASEIAFVAGIKGWF